MADSDEQYLGVVELAFVNVAGEILLSDIAVEASCTGSQLVRRVAELLDEAKANPACTYRLLYDGKVISSNVQLGEALSGATSATLQLCSISVVEAWERCSGAITLSHEASLAELVHKRTGPFHMAIARALPPGSCVRWEVVIGQANGAIRSFGVVPEDGLTEDLIHPNHSNYSPDRSLSWETSSAQLYLALLDKQPLENIPQVYAGSIVIFELAAGTLSVYIANPLNLSEDDYLAVQKDADRLGPPDIEVGSSELVITVDGLDNEVLYPFVCFYQDNYGNQAWIRPSL